MAYYLSEDPRVSTLGDPQTLLLSDAFIVFFSAVVFPTFALAAFSEFLGLLEAPEGFGWSPQAYLADERFSMQTPPLTCGLC